MSYNGSGTFVINTSGQPVVTGTVISSTAFNALTADLATGLSTAITKDGQTAATARIPFAQGISSTLVTDSTSTTTGSIITAGGAGIAKALFVGTTANVAGAVTLQSTLAVGGVATYSAQPIFSSLTASSAVATDASKGLVSVTNTGTGNNVLATSPTLVTPVLGAASATSVTFDAGAVGTPSITTTGDTNTGIFFPAADTIAFAEGGAEAMRINSSGNVGIGTTSPTARLTLASGTNEGAVRVGDNATFYGELARVQATDEVRLGSYGGSQNLTFYTVSSERARIDSSGNFLVAATTSAATNNTDGFRVIAGGIPTVQRGAAGSFAIFYNSTNSAVIGSITNSGGAATLFNTTSDYRLKTVTGSVTGQGARIDALKPIDYQWTEGGQNSRGFLAHEFQEVYAGSVSGTKDAVDADGKPVYQAMQASSSEVIADLVAEIQDLRKRITALEAA